MDIFLTLIGVVFIIIGILGSFLPVLPGPTMSWVGLLLLHLTEAVPDDWWFLGITLVIALIVFALDYIIPAIGTKKFGGTRAGMIGTTIGLIVGIIAPIPFGIILGMRPWVFGLALDAMKEEYRKDRLVSKDELKS